MEQNKFDDNIEFDSVDVSHEHAHPSDSGSKLQTSNSQLPRWQPFILPVAILIAAILVSGTILYSKGMIFGGSGTTTGDPNEPPAKVKIVLNNDEHVLGNPKAKVTIVEFSDFQCPFCRSFWEGAYVQIKTQYIDTGKAKLVFKHFPLAFHSMAVPSALATECASEQGKFWEMHDKLFQEQAKLGENTVAYTNTNLKKWAAQLGLNAGQFNSCLDADKYGTRITSDQDYGTTVGVGGTPTFFVNGNRIVGAQPFAAFKALIEEEL